jgi:azurin
MKNLNKVILFMAFIMLVTISCKGDKKAETSAEPDSKTEVVEEEVVKEELTTKVSTDGTLEIAGDDAMMFDKKELKVKAGQKVTLTLTHVGKMGLNIMGHNWVLLKQGTYVAKFADKAIEAGPDKGYLPEEDSIIASTKLIGGGESVTITFDAPAAGTYDFICSFPGHYGIMQGKFIVE